MPARTWGCYRYSVYTQSWDRSPALLVEYCYSRTISLMHEKIVVWNFHAYNWVQPNYSWKFLGWKVHARGEIFIFMHGFIIFMHEKFIFSSMKSSYFQAWKVHIFMHEIEILMHEIFMPRFSHAWNFSSNRKQFFKLGECKGKRQDKKTRQTLFLLLVFIYFWSCGRCLWSCNEVLWAKVSAAAKW